MIVTELFRHSFKRKRHNVPSTYQLQASLRKYSTTSDVQNAIIGTCYRQILPISPLSVLVATSHATESHESPPFPNDDNEH
jgi:hypothetical protein